MGLKGVRLILIIIIVFSHHHVVFDWILYTVYYQSLKSYLSA